MADGEEVHLVAVIGSDALGLVVRPRREPEVGDASPVWVPLRCLQVMLADTLAACCRAPPADTLEEDGVDSALLASAGAMRGAAANSTVALLKLGNTRA